MRKYDREVGRFRISGQGSVSGGFTTQAIPPSTSAVATPNGLALDGQPFFPRMVFQQCPYLFPSSLAAGINLFVGAGCGASRSLLDAASGRAFQWIEAGTMTGCSKFVPTPASVEAETWLAIAGGARGIGYFPDSWQPDIAARIAAVDRRIAALAPALLAPERPVAYLPNAVRAGARTLAGATYVIAVNASYRLPAKARITLPGFTAHSIRVYGEGRTLPVRNGVFADTLAPLQARIYVAPPPGAP